MSRSFPVPYRIRVPNARRCDHRKRKPEEAPSKRHHAEHASHEEAEAEKNWPAVVREVRGESTIVATSPLSSFCEETLAARFLLGEMPSDERRDPTADHEERGTADRAENPLTGHGRILGRVRETPYLVIRLSSNVHVG